MTRPIVVAIDLSKPSIVALEEALPIARRRGAEIVLVHATPMPESYEWLSPGTIGERYPEMLKDELARTRSALSDLRERHLGQGVEISTTIVAGNADHTIADAADSADAQLIVVGSHGREGLNRFLLGSTAEHVSRFTTRDVLVARSEHPRGDYKKILIATDFSETSERAFDTALSLAADDGSVTIVHCVEVPAMVAGYYTGQILEDAERASAARADELTERGRTRGLDVNVIIRGGYPPSHIHELAAGHDLIVMGSHGRGGFRRFFLGSVTEKTIRHAPCSVYVARARPTETKDEEGLD